MFTPSHKKEIIDFVINLNTGAKVTDTGTGIAIDYDADSIFPVTSDNKTTLVTALWNLGREEIGTSFTRKYQDYLDRFEQLLKTPANMYIFVDEADEEFVWKHRSKSNTVVKLMSVSELAEWFPFTELTDKKRQETEWLSQAGWLADSTQAKLKMYNPLVMSKMFMLNNVSIWNPFESDNFYWIDAGITHTVHPGYFTHDRVIEKLHKFNDRFMFITFPYLDGGEIHGFPRTTMNSLAGVENVEYVCRGGMFGGPKKYINNVNGVYYGALHSTLSQGLMGTEESVFTLISYTNPELFNLFSVEGNGLIGKFFEDLKNETLPLVKDNVLRPVADPTVALYVLTFNSPKQFETLIESYLQHEGFVSKTKNYLIDNSTDLDTTEEYLNLCKKYNFEHIKKENIGICGGRQFVAEHFDSTDHDFYIFLEDDMNLMPVNTETCGSGFNRYHSTLFNTSVDIINNERYDFLKLSFSEFFGTNTNQWSWYNVPQTVREEYFPDKTKLPVQGLDPNAPKTVFNHIKSLNKLPYTDGDIYYCNWPQIVSRAGNKKMFLDVTWAHPFEQTWMSHIFQMTKKSKIKGALLLLSPINHDRFDHYDRSIRRES